MVAGLGSGHSRESGLKGICWSMRKSFGYKMMIPKTLIELN